MAFPDLPYGPHGPTFHSVLHPMIRVNHAGEDGAKRIYEGQLKALKNHGAYTIIEHMYHQELEHLRTFDDLMKHHNVRPTFLSPLWNRAAYALGWLSGKIGIETAMAITVAVEEVIDDHYKEQIDTLHRYAMPDSIPQHITHENNVHDDVVSLAKTLERFRQDEQEHRDCGLEHEAEKAPFYPLIKECVKAITRFAIFVSKKI